MDAATSKGQPICLGASNVDDVSMPVFASYQAVYLGQIGCMSCTAHMGQASSCHGKGTGLVQQQCTNLLNIRPICAAEYAEKKLRDLVDCIAQLQQGLEGSTVGAYDADLESLAVVCRATVSITRQVDLAALQPARAPGPASGVPMCALDTNVTGSEICLLSCILSQYSSFQKLNLPSAHDFTRSYIVLWHETMDG